MKVKIQTTRADDCLKKGYHIGQPTFDFQMMADDYKYRKVRVIRCGHCNGVIEVLA